MKLTAPRRLIAAMAIVGSVIGSVIAEISPTIIDLNNLF